MTASRAEMIDPRFLEHGGRLDVARTAYPHAPEPWLDLSTGLSPWSYPAPETPPGELKRLPSPAFLQKLSETARAAYRAPAAAEIVPAPGTDLALSVLPWLFRTPRRVAVLAPAYSGHRTAWEAAGHSVSEIGALERIGRAAILIVVNPNNPDGRFIRQDDLAACLSTLSRRDGLLIVDEAFADAEETHSLLPVARRLDRTLVLRSVGKFYGAGGVRLGFAITSHPVAGRLRSALGAWPLGEQALAFGQAALADRGWQAMQRARLREAARALDAALAEGGLRILGGTALFRFAAHTAAFEVFAHLAGQGILTRPFSGGATLRFGLPKDEGELARLREALKSAPTQRPDRS